MDNFFPTFATIKLTKRYFLSLVKNTFLGTEFTFEMDNKDQLLLLDVLVMRNGSNK